MFYRTSAGAEIDLLLEIPGKGLWVIEIKLGLSARPEKGFFIACDDVKPSKRFVANSGTERHRISEVSKPLDFMRWRQCCRLCKAVLSYRTRLTTSVTRN